MGAQPRSQRRELGTNNLRAPDRQSTLEQKAKYLCADAQSQVLSAFSLWDEHGSVVKVEIIEFQAHTFPAPHPSRI
jgi:hypothetical protein